MLRPDFIPVSSRSKPSITTAVAPQEATEWRVGKSGPQAESIMVLAGENYAPHAPTRQRADDRIRITCRWLEHARIFVAITPLTISKRC